MKLLKPLVVLFAILILPSFSYAQTADIQSLQQALTVVTAPQYPTPYSPVTISIQSYTYDLSSASISWRLNGKTLSQGIGDKFVQINTGAIGVTQTLTVSVMTATGKTFSKDIAVTPTDVTFLTQANTYTPPLYEGKGIFTRESQVIVTAIPQIGSGAGIDPSNLVYHWTLNGTVLDDQSGYGKQSLIVNGNYWGRDETIDVAVSTTAGDTVAENSITLHPNDSQLLVYEDDPLLGLLLNNAQTTTFNLKSSSEASFFAAPFGFLLAQMPHNTTYAWTMNGSTASDESGNSITFRNDSGKSGISVVDVTAEQPKTDFQSAEAGFSIQF